jgi:hypothetical protein
MMQHSQPAEAVLLLRPWILLYNKITAGSTLTLKHGLPHVFDPIMTFGTATIHGEMHTTV